MSVPESHPQPQHKPQAKPTTRATASESEELKVVQHSQLFYWWPVWAAGFIMFFISWLGGEHMALVPRDAEIERTADGYALQVKGTPPGQIAELKPGGTMRIDDVRSPFHVHVSSIKGLAVLFTAVLILVILITNVPLRGMWSVVVIITVVLLLVIISLMPGWWEAILSAITWLDIRINAAGYLVISTALFIIWAVTFYLFDRQIYIIFTPGQMKVREQIGGGETVYDTQGMTTQHLQDDFFRHRVLGLGSGDLIVRTAGAHSHEFRWSNVLFVRRKLQQIEDMQKEKPVVAGG